MRSRRCSRGPWWQTCIVHLIRSSTRFVAWVNRKALIGDLRLVLRSPHEDAALVALAEFEEADGWTLPMVAQAWRSNWERVRPSSRSAGDGAPHHLPTNAIESLNFTLRKVTKARGHFPATRRRSTGLPRDPQYGKKWNTAAEVPESRPESVLDHVRRTTARVTGNGGYTKSGQAPELGNAKFVLRV